MSSNHILNQNKPLAEMPELNGEKLNARARCVSRKPVSRNCRSNNQMGNVKYDVKVPCNVKEALLFDKANGDNLWEEAIIKEVSAIMGQKTFEYLEGSYRTSRQKGLCSHPYA